MSRGSLIFPMAIEIARIDVASTRDNGGYDDRRAEPRIISPDDEIPPIGSVRGVKATRYLDPVIVEAQVEDHDTNALIAALTGKNTAIRFGVVIHYAELEAEGLVDALGRPRFRIGDKLTRILDPDTHEPIVVIPDPPGVYATEVNDQSFGLSSRERNLLYINFERRSRGEAQ